MGRSCGSFRKWLGARSSRSGSADANLGNGCWAEWDLLGLGSSWLLDVLCEVDDCGEDGDGS